MSTPLENAFAVIIGVDDNQVSRLALPTVAKDVQAVYDVLVHPQRCGYAKDNVRLHTGAEATQDNIFDAFFWLQDQIKAHPNATAIVYFSGHGLFDPRSEQYYLIPYDIGEMRRIRQKAIKAEVIGAEIAALEPERLLVVLDCCHADGMGMKNVEPDSLDGPLPAAFPLDLPETKGIPTVEDGGKGISALAQGNGRAILNSSTGAESSYIRRDGAMSVFTYHFIEALTGHAPHDTDATTVLVTDVMSYVTRKVAATAQAEGRKQTPVMKTTGVFPVAMLLGGTGTKGIDALPDPLEPLPDAATTQQNTTFNQENQTVHRDQYNIGRDAHIDQIGNTTTHNTGGGDYVAGNKTSAGRDYIAGSVVQGDKIVGEHKTADLSAEFIPLLIAAAQLPDTATKTDAITKLNALQAEISRSTRADDERIAGLVEDLAALMPQAHTQLRDLLDHPLAAHATGPVTQFMLKRIANR